MIFTDEGCNRVEMETWMYLMKVYLDDSELAPNVSALMWGKKMVLDVEDELEIRKYLYAALQLAINDINDEIDLDNPRERGIMINTPNKKYKLKLSLEEVK